MTKSDDHSWMQLAIDLAAKGEGHVEPNPMVGCVLVRDGKLIGKGFHQRFGGSHAEVEAIADAGDARGATAYVTLEPCCHQGKTPPCSNALIEASVSRVVVAAIDPTEKVAGQGLQQLRASGIEVTVGVMEDEANQLNRPWLKLVQSGMPWVIAKWAMTLDGKLATASGSSQWISGEQSRVVVHQIRGRVDGIIVGIGTALADDPQLTARPTGPRTAARIVLDSQARLPLDSKLVSSAKAAPVIVVVAAEADSEKTKRLATRGCEILELESSDQRERIEQLLLELGRREFTNVLVEGGGAIHGSFLDAGCVDEVHCFIAPKLLGGIAALSPVGGEGIEDMTRAIGLNEIRIEQLGTDVHVSGQIGL